MASVLTLICWVHLCLFVILFLIAACGRRLGLRKRYIQLLLRLFQFSQQKVDKKRKIRVPSVSLDDSDATDEIQKLSFSQPKYLGIDSEGQSGFHMGDILEYVAAGVSAIVEDTVLTNFIPEEPPCWNLLTRTNTRAYEFISFRLTLLWMIGFFIRYFFLLPTRLLVLVIGMAFLLVCTLVVGAIPDGPLKRRLNGKLNIFCFDFVAGSLSLFATFHNPENRPKSGITVANHTSPIDSMILSTDNVYDMVGQIHTGLLGYFMTLLSRSSTHIWFERSNSKDRSDVARRLKEHTANSELPPILIFPEGVCVNNTSVVQFKKGAFEIDCVIYPVAIRFDPRFGDAYWWQDAFFSYVVYMMTSWAIVCDVWYLPPVTRRPDETAIAFANRVKATIAVKGGMTDVSIDGFLKVNPPKADLKTQYQLEFAKHCRRLSSTPRLSRLVSSNAHQQKTEINKDEIIPAFELELSLEDNEEVLHPPGGSLDDSGDISSGAVSKDQSVATLEEESRPTPDGGGSSSELLMDVKRIELKKGHQGENQEIRQRIPNNNTETNFRQMDDKYSPGNCNIRQQAISSEISKIDGSPKLLVELDNSNLVCEDSCGSKFSVKDLVAVDSSSDYPTEEGRRVAAVQETDANDEMRNVILSKSCQDSLADENRRKCGNAE